MLKIEVPILTEEYKINVYLGTRNQLIKYGGKYLEKTKEQMEEFLKDKRGVAFNCFGIGKAPLLLINTSYPIADGIATIAHEASHAMDDIEERLGVKDVNGEIHAHGIGSVMRHVLKKLKKLKNEFANN